MNYNYQAVFGGALNSQIKIVDASSTVGIVRQSERSATAVAMMLEAADQLFRGFESKTIDVKFNVSVSPRLSSPPKTIAISERTHS
jgi:hypothetical protein